MTKEKQLARAKAIAVLECMAVDLTGALAESSKTNPMTDVLEQRLEAIDTAQEALREQPHWISVEERLPEKSTPVLAYKDGRIWYCERNWQSGCWESLSFAATKEYGMYWSKGPTHWMPLPSAPKEEV